MSDLHHVSKFAERRRRNNIWRSVVTFVAALVVFCTTYALILPAITMETEGLSCGMEAHTHTEECCQLTCGKQEYFSHTHTEECYEEEELICPLEERTIHHHTDDCYSSAQPICGLSQCEPHAHSEGCYGLQNVLICGQSACEPHAHGESCYTDGALTCTLEETAGHTHTEECYEEQQALTCTLEETEGHTHTEECYPSDFEPKLICEQEDIPEHRHTEDCYIRTCEKEAHIHTDECVSTPEAFLQNQNVINPNVEAGVPKVDWTDPTAAEEAGYVFLCDNEDEEHIHTEDCYLSMEEYQTLYAGVTPFAVGTTVEKQQTDLSQYLTSIATTEPYYNPTTGNYDTALTFNFVFPRTDGKYPAYDYVMELKGVVVPDSLLKEGYGLLDSASNPAGTYDLYKDAATGKYYIKIKMNQSYVDSKTQDITGFVSFNGSLGASTKQEDGSLKVEYRQDLSIEVLPDKIHFDKGARDYDLSSEKIGSYNKDTGELTYEVRLYSTKGTPDKIKYEDVMEPNGLPITEKSVSVQKGTYENYQISNLQPVPDSGLGISEEAGKLVSRKDDLAGLGQNQCYVITYTYKIDTDQLNYDYLPKNKITAEGEKDGQKVTTQAYKNDLQVSNGYSLTKSGSFDSNKINWVITVNSGKSNISGMYIQDGMLRSENSTVVVEPNSGWAWDGDKIVFSAVSEGENKNEYTITYSTLVTPTLEPQTAKNDVDLKKDDKTIKSASSGDVPYSTELITKEVTSITAPNETNSHLTMHWKVMVNVPVDGFPEGTTIVENTDRNSSSGHTIKVGTVKLQYANGDTVTGADIKMWDNQYAIGTEWGQPVGGDQPYMTIELPTISYDAAKSPIILTYDTESNNGIEGEYLFGNTAKIGDKSKYVEYPYRFPVNASLTKTDGNGNTGSTGPDSSGKFTWKVNVKVGSDWDAAEIKIFDELPTNVSLDTETSGYLKIKNPNNQELSLTVGEGGAINHTENDFTYSGTYNSSTRVLELVIRKKDGSKFTAGDMVTLTYQCKIDDSYASEKADGYEEAFVNKVTVYHDGVQFNHDPVTHTQKWKKHTQTPPGDKVLLKGGTWDSSFSRETYSVKINPKAETLLPGADGLVLQDTLQYKRGNHMADYYLVMGSVKLYELNPDGSRKGELAPSQWSWTTSDNILSEGISSTEQWRLIKKMLNVKVPDGKALELVYTYRLEVAAPQAYPLNPSNDLGLKNTVTLNGVSNSDDTYTPLDESWEASGTQGGVSTPHSWTFTKVDQDNNGVILGGAVFQVAKYVYSENSWIWEDVTGKQYTCGSGSPDDPTYGRFTVKLDDGYDKNTLYKVYEVTPPAGYSLPEDQSGHMFYFKDDTVTPNNLPTDLAGQTLVNMAFDLMKVSGGDQLVPNKRGPQTEITVKKLWMQTDGSTPLTENLPDSITVKLYKRSAGSTEAGTFVQDIIVSKSDNWQTTVGNLPVEAGMEYYVQEVPVDGFMTGQPAAEGGNTFTITNTKKPSYTLPNTGGMGTSVFTLAGLALSIGACLGLMKKRRRGDADDQ